MFMCVCECEPVWGKGGERYEQWRWYFIREIIRKLLCRLGFCIYECVCMCVCLIERNKKGEKKSLRRLDVHIYIHNLPLAFALLVSFLSFFTLSFLHIFLYTYKHTNTLLLLLLLFPSLPSFPPFSLLIGWFLLFLPPLGPVPCQNLASSLHFQGTKVATPHLRPTRSLAACKNRHVYTPIYQGSLFSVIPCDVHASPPFPITPSVPTLKLFNFCNNRWIHLKFFQ